MSKSYEKLIEELYATDKLRLESTLESDAKEILNDTKMRDLLQGYITRLDKNSHIEPNSLIAIRYFEALLRIHNLEDFKQEQYDLEDFCTNRYLLKVVDDSSLHEFLEAQKLKIYRKVDESYEYRNFKDYLRKKYQAKNFRNM